MARVLAFSDYYSGQTSGGAERVAHEVYTRLARDHGLEVAVMAAVPRGALKLAAPDHVGGISVVTHSGVDLSRLMGVQLTLSPTLIWDGMRTVASFKPDVLHANSLHFQGSVLAAWIARRNSIPLVTTAHLGGVGYMHGLRGMGANAWDNTLGRFIVANSSALVAVSPSVATHLRSLGGPSLHIELAPNGVDHAVFHARDRQPHSGPLRVGLIGRLIANKGPRLALEAVGALRMEGRPMTLCVLGDGPLLQRLQRRSIQPDLRGAVTFCGRVEDVAQRMRTLDVVVRPSQTEGLPLVVLEAMASGAVVVASAVPGNADLIDDGRTGLLVRVGDAMALADALRRLDDDRLLLERLQRDALATASHYSWESSAAMHLRGFEWALNGRTGGPLTSPTGC